MIRLVDVFKGTGIVIVILLLTLVVIAVLDEPGGGGWVRFCSDICEEADR